MHPGRLGQLMAVERLLRHEKRTRDKNTGFAGLIWGDFNTRLVAFDGLETEMFGKHDKLRLSDNGVQSLCGMISDPKLRRSSPLCNCL